MFKSTKFGSYNATIDQDISQSLVFYFIVDTVYKYIWKVLPNWKQEEII